MNRKLAWLMARTTTDVDAEVFRAFAAIYDGEVASIRTSWPSWSAGRTIRLTGAFANWFNSAQAVVAGYENLEFGGKFNAFVTLEYDKWLKCYPDGVAGAVDQNSVQKYYDDLAAPSSQVSIDDAGVMSLSQSNLDPVRVDEGFGQPKPKVADVAPIIFFDPKSHIGLPHVAWDDHGVVDQRYMYTDRQAAAQWAGIRGRETYGLYNICKTLAKSSINLIQLESPNIEQLILLGAGSPDKDWEIIFQIASTNKNNALDIFICDASFYMLMETKEELEKYIKINKAFVKEENIRIILSCFDFTRPQAWTSCSFDRSKITIFAILGGTIGNVSEAEFFQCLKMNSKVNDYLIVAGSFYESSDDLSKNGKAHIDQQYGNDAKALSLNSVSDVLDSADQTLSFEDKIKLVDVTFEDAHDLYPKISSRIPSTQSAVFSIKTSSIRKKPEHLDRIERIFLLTSKRYVREEFCKYITSRKGMTLTLLGNFKAESSIFPFCHLVFRFSEGLNDTNA